MRDYSRTEITEAIDEWILNERNRCVLYRRLIDGITADIQEEAHMQTCPTQTMAEETL